MANTTKEEKQTKLFKEDILSGSNDFSAAVMNGDTLDILRSSIKSKFGMARNAVSLSPVGDYFAISNEMSNRLVASAPYTIIGCIYIHNGEWAIFSTDNNNSEIGIFNEYKLTYTPYVNSKELGFSKSNLIKGIGRLKTYGHRMVYWDDDLNPSRCLDLDDIPWKGVWAVSEDNCKTFVNDKDIQGEFSDFKNHNKGFKVLDVSKCRLQLTTKKGINIKAKVSGYNGEIQNGTYAFIGAYTKGGVDNRITNFFNLSNRVYVFNHDNAAGAIELKIDTDDESFEEYSIWCIRFANQSTSVTLVGTYSTGIKTVNISQINTQQPAVSLEQLFFSEYSVPEKSAGIFKVGDYLLRIKPTLHQEFNYQPYANKIKTWWVAVEYDKYYYRDGGTNVGYMRDEVYSFFIRWVYDTGDKSKFYHIPGNMDYNPGASHPEGIKKNMEYDGGRVVDVGMMEPWESQERYNDKKEIVFGDLCGKKIRHHKMPDNNKSPHFTDENHICVLGVSFTDIVRPKKDVFVNNKWVQVDIDNIIGYEIYRGSRQGNASIIAKGMVNNMKHYINGSENNKWPADVYFQNYPYNSSNEVFLTPFKYVSTTDKSENYQKALNGVMGLDKNMTDYIDYYERQNDYFTFHTPDLIKTGEYGKESSAYLSAKYLRNYGVLQGVMKDLTIWEPIDAPRFKLLRDKGFYTIMILAIGFSIFKMFGSKKKTVQLPKVNLGGTMTLAGAASGGEGMTNISAGASLAQIAGFGITKVLRQTLLKIANNNKPLVTATTGVNIENTVSENFDNVADVTGTMTNTPQQKIEQTETQPLDEVPLWMRAANAFPIFMTYYSQGLDDLMKILYSFARKRQHIVQQASHGLYNKYVKKQIEDLEISGKTYLSDGVYAMPKEDNPLNDNNIIIDNRHRPDAIALHTSTSLNKIILEKEKSQIDSWAAGKEEYKLYSLYGALYQELPSQYGQLDDVKPVIATDKLILFGEQKQIIFGGDTYINKWTEKNTMQFFNDISLGNNPDNDDEIDFWGRKWIPNPHYWLNSEKYDFDHINETFTNLFKRSTAITFEPFEMTTRFQDTNVNYKNNGIDKEIVNPEVVYCEGTTKYVKEDTFYNLDLYNDIQDEEERNEKKQECISSINSKRSCSCDFFKFLYEREVMLDEGIRNDMLEKLRMARRGIQSNSDDDDDDKLELSPYDIVYGKSDMNGSRIDPNSRNFISSPINCRFYKYRNTSEVKISDDVRIAEAWYNEDYKLKISDYKKLCDKSDEVAKYDFKLAVFEGYIRFLQHVINVTVHPDTDDEYEYYRCNSCWDNFKKYDKINQDNAEGKDDLLADALPNSWNDDYEDSGYYFLHGWEAGVCNGIPYTLNPDKINPLLLYFISEETSYDLKYPTVQEVEDDWNNPKTGAIAFERDKLEEKEKGKNKGLERGGIELMYYNDQHSDFKNKDLPFFYNTKTKKFKFNESKCFENFQEWKEGTESNIYIGKNKKINKIQALDMLTSKDRIDINVLMRCYDAVTGDDNMEMWFGKENYWTLNGVRKFLSKNGKGIKTKTRKFTHKKLGELGWTDVGLVSTYYDKNTDHNNIAVPKYEQCREMKKYFDKGSGDLYSKYKKKITKDSEKSSKKYTKELKKHQKAFEKKSKSGNLIKNIYNKFKEFLPSSYYCLDYINDNTSHFKGVGYFFVRNMAMYAYVSGVRDFFVESTRNVAFRDWGVEISDKFYDDRYFTDLKSCFNSHILGTEYKEEKRMLNRHFISDEMLASAMGSGFAKGPFLHDKLYDPYEYALHREKMKNRMMYSDPDKKEHETDSWRIFRMDDAHDFEDEITTVLSIGNNGALVLFKNDSPVAFTDQVSLSGSENNLMLRSTVGTGELFQKSNIKHLSFDNAYENFSCQDSLSAIATPDGIFYVDSEHSNIYSYGKSIMDLTTITSKLSRWFETYMPIRITQEDVYQETEFDLLENPVFGVGYQTSFDKTNHIVYFSKKDYTIKDSAKKEYNNITYKGNGLYLFDNTRVMLGDDKFFDDASFTLSLDMKKATGGGWCSFHDWHPDLTMSSSERIFSTKDNRIYRHNDSPQSYCKFYDKYYPFEIEFQLTSENSVSTLSGISYYLETFKYEDNGYDRYHTMYDNFDKALIYNSEQISGTLNLFEGDYREIMSNPMHAINYPRLGDDKQSFDILWSKEEQRYRFNQFWDITNDRMRDIPMFKTEPNGYIRTINPDYVDYMKPEFERKKFRHLSNNLRLTKITTDNNNNINFVFKMNLNINLKSFR